MPIKIVERPNHKVIRSLPEYIGIGGIFSIIHHEALTGIDRYYKFPNLIVDVGIKHVGDILANVETTNTDIAFMEPGSGTTTPVVGDSDTETPLTPADRLAVTSVTRSGAFPFEIEASTFINSTTYTRPQTINELVIFFGPDETGNILARGVLVSGIVLNTDDTATLIYSLIFR